MKTTLSSKLADKRLAVLGAGKIGGILLRAFLQQKLVQPKRVHATVRHAEKDHLEIARAMFEAVGRVVDVDEKQIDAVTGLSASGTAFIYIILESLAEGGVKVGLPRDVSTLLAAQTMMGAARMVLDTGDHPALLKDAVTTPAGSTMDGILELEDGKLRVTLIKAVMKATQHAKELILES